MAQVNRRPLRSLVAKRMKKLRHLTSLPALALRTGEIYVNTDNVDLYWSILPKGDTKDVRKTVSTGLLSCWAIS